jgi:hypothetical protein
MNDIEPWLDTDAPLDVAESLRAARSEAPRRAVVERCVTLIGAAGAVALSSSVAGAAASGAGGKALGAALLVKWGLAGFAGGVVLIAGVELTERASQTSKSQPQPRSPPPMASSTGPATDAPPVRPAAPPLASVESPVRRSVPLDRAPGSSTDQRLAAELSLLSSVRAAIDRRDADTALRLLVEHARRHPMDARLLPEARYLRLEALELAGRPSEARDVARRILELDPRGPHAARAREVLEKE